MRSYAGTVRIYHIAYALTELAAQAEGAYLRSTLLQMRSCGGEVFGDVLCPVDAKAIWGCRGSCTANLRLLAIGSQLGTGFLSARRSGVFNLVDEVGVGG